MITKFTTECFGMKKMTCGHLLSASLVKKILAEKDINFHDMTLAYLIHEVDCIIPRYTKSNHNNLQTDGLSHSDPYQPTNMVNREMTT